MPVSEPWQAPAPDLQQPALPAQMQFIDSDSLTTVAPQQIVDLSSLFPSPAELVGVALDPHDAAAPLYVLEAHTGLYRLGSKAEAPAPANSSAGASVADVASSDGSAVEVSRAELVFDLKASRVLGGTGDGSPPAELTDVAFDPERSAASGAPGFALTAENDGFALALGATALDAYFCYLPNSFEPLTTPSPSLSQELRQQGVAVAERTEALALNPITLQIIAQPRTLRLDGGGVAGSELFVFDTQGGNPLGTWRLEQSEFAAGGAVFLFGSSLVLGSGADLYFVSNFGGNVQKQLHLTGVEQITGIALDADSSLIVLDGPNRRLVELSLDQIRAALDGSQDH